MKQPIQFDSQTENPNLPGVTDISAEELQAKCHCVHIVDVRQPDEFYGELGHIQGAKLLVLDELPSKLDELPKEEPVVLVCRSGARSARATAFLQESGFKYVYNLEGGMLRWNQLGFDVERE